VFIVNTVMPALVTTEITLMIRKIFCLRNNNEQKLQRLTALARIFCQVD
jgi:hypothetical protein